MSDTTFGSTYVSCIKIKGIHLLPPVITPSRRLELQKDKQQAIKLERRLQNCKELKKNLDELMTLHSLTDSPHFIGNSHIEDLGITSSRSSIQSKKKPNLIKDILDVTEYSHDGIKLIKDKDMVFEPRQGQIEFRQGRLLSTNSCSSDAYDTDSSLNKSSDIAISSVMSSARDQISQCPSVESISRGRSELQGRLPKSPKSVKSTKSLKSPKIPKSSKSPTSPARRLIRSNSYTLEAPSPILLAHLEKCSKNGDTTSVNVDTNLSRTWTSLENTFIPLAESEFSSLNTVYNTGINDNDVTTEIHVNKLYDINMQPQKDIEEKHPTIEVVQTDISVQQITVNANTENVEPIKGTLDLSDPDCQLMQVLKKIPEDYSKQIIELIEKQRSEHLAKVENFEKQFSNSKLVHSTPANEEKRNDDDSSISEISNRSHYYNLSDTLTQIGSPTVKEARSSATFDEKHTAPKASASIQDLFTSAENFIDDNLQKTPEKQRNRTIQKVSSTNVEELIKNFEPSQESVSKRFENVPNFDRKLFATYRDAEDIKKEWAANVICAHVKGYLTRRLLKTAKVQSLIDTIRDALLCALELHKVEQIDEADIELHRRLINQVSAACYAFHDIFFALTIPEKMVIISTDRKRINEKSSRPSSAPNIHRSLSNSSRSSTRSFHSQSHGLMNI